MPAAPKGAGILGAGVLPLAGTLANVATIFLVWFQTAREISTSPLGRVSCEPDSDCPPGKNFLANPLISKLVTEFRGFKGARRWPSEPCKPEQTPLRQSGHLHG